MSRRRFAVNATLVAGTELLPVWLAEPLLAQTTTPLVRSDVNGTSAAAKEAIAIYRMGVATMKSRPSHDPTSWLFQANIHSWPGQFRRTASDPEQEFRDTFSAANTTGLSAGERSRREQLARKVWGTCTHSDPADRFLPWHRLYLFFFERIIRAAAGVDASSTASLPYWNWTKDRALPLPFREAINGTQDGNALFWNNRKGDVTRVQSPASISPVSVRVADLLDLSGFSASLDPALDAGFSDNLEGGPHGNVHVWVQNPPRGMGFFEEAGRDPIFWLHHCNIDRLWSHWRAASGHREPLDAQVGSDQSWGDFPSTFVDIDGQPKTLTARQVLIASEILDRGYVYDDLMPAAVGGIVMAQADNVVAPAAVASAADPKTIARSGPVTISGLSRIQLQPVAPNGGPNALAPAAVVSPNVLVVKDIAAEPAGPALYGVYLNLPENMPPDPQGPYFAGTINTFNAQAAGKSAAGPHAGHTLTVERRLPVSNLLRQQQQSGLWSGEAVTVTVATLPEDEGGQPQVTAPANVNPNRSSSLMIGSFELLGR